MFKKIALSAFMLASVVSFSACKTNGASEWDEAGITNHPYYQISVTESPGGRKLVDVTWAENIGPDDVVPPFVDSNGRTHTTVRIENDVIENR